MAEFGSGPEPLGGFYVGIVFEKQSFGVLEECMILWLNVIW